MMRACEQHRVQFGRDDAILITAEIKQAADQNRQRQDIDGEDAQHNRRQPWPFRARRRDHMCGTGAPVAVVVSSERIQTFLVPVPDAVQRFDLGEVGIDFLELLAQALDVAVDGAVVDIDRLRHRRRPSVGRGF